MSRRASETIQLVGPGLEGTKVAGRTSPYIPRSYNPVHSSVFVQNPCNSFRHHTREFFVVHYCKITIYVNIPLTVENHKQESFLEVFIVYHDKIKT